MCAENVKMKNRKLAIITVSALLFAATSTVAISFVITEDVFAKYGDTSQAAAVSNECLNPLFDSNSIDNAVGIGNCGSTVSQQDESGSASAPVTSQTANPTIELQRATTTTEEPSTSFGIVKFGISSCANECPETLTFDVSTAVAASPSTFMMSSQNPPTQTLSFASPPTWTLTLTNVGTDAVVMTPTAGSACQGGTVEVTGNIPPAGETVTCTVSIIIDQSP